MRGFWFDAKASRDLPEILKERGAWIDPKSLIAKPLAECFRFDPSGLELADLGLQAEARGADVLVVPDDCIRLCLFDMDSTLIQHEVIDELADAFGIGAAVAAITERSMAGELDFVESFQERLALLSGLPESNLAAIAARLQLMPGAEVLLKNLTAQGVRCGIVSGGFSYFAERIGDRLGMDFVLSNTLECVDGHVSGRVVPPVIDGSAKLKTLVEERSRLNLTVNETMAVGDGANDIPMLTAAGVGVAFRAKPKVQNACQNRVTHADLGALSYLLA